MVRKLGVLSGAALILTGASAPADRADVSGDCRLARIGADGKTARKASSSSTGASSSARASSSGSHSSSVSSSSSSSSSRSGGKSRSVATSTVNGRTITTVHDENGCTVTVDER